MYRCSPMGEGELTSYTVHAYCYTQLVHTVDGYTHCCRDVRLLLVKSMIPPIGFKRSPAVPRPIPFMMPTAPSSLPPDRKQAKVILWDISTIIQVWTKYEAFYWGWNVYVLTYTHSICKATFNRLCYDPSDALEQTLQKTDRYTISATEEHIHSTDTTVTLLILTLPSPPNLWRKEESCFFFS